MKKLFLSITVLFACLSSSAQIVTQEIQDQIDDCLAKPMYELGSVYLNGNADDESIKNAIDWYRNNVNEHDKELLMSVGRRYIALADDKFAEISKSQDWDTAVKKTKEYYGEAFAYMFVTAMLGNAEAEYYIGDIFFKGIAIDKDLKKAFLFYHDAAINGYTKAYYPTGLCLKNGLGTLEDEAEAYAWFEKGGDAGDDRCINIATVDAVSYTEDEVLIDKDKFFKWTSELNNKEESEKTLFVLGFCYYNGIGCETNYAEAVRLWKKSIGYKKFGAGTGSFYSLISIASCYRDGYGVEQNEATAQEIEKSLDYFTGSMYNGDDKEKIEKDLFKLLGI